jgi:pectate lyase
MRVRRALSLASTLTLTAATLSAFTLSAPASATSPHSSVGTGTDTRTSLAWGHQPLPANDGWAAGTTGTTGGSTADATHTYVVHDRVELDAALAAGSGTPKIIYVDGVIDGNTSATGAPLTCADYADPGYTFAGYLAAYVPAVWGRTTRPSGPLEEARARSAANQAKRVQIKIGSNTTIVGLGPDAGFQHANLYVGAGTDNVIVRNLRLTDAADCFPQWDPTDTSVGNWNSNYDLMSVTGGTHVWVDHVSFSDGSDQDAAQPLYFNRPYQVHDGELDITKGADFVTASWNDFADHDKTMLIGSTDSPTYDVGKLHVTLHHDRFGNVLERVPRVRYGQVDVYDNYYLASSAQTYQYSLGAGVNSAIYASNNVFQLAPGIPVGSVIHYWGGTALHADGSALVGPDRRPRPVDLVAAYNAANTVRLGTDVGWTPTLRDHVDSAAQVIRELGTGSGPHRTVGPNGDFPTVQAAVDAVPAGNALPYAVAVRPGTYREVVNVPATKPDLTLAGTGRRPQDVVISYDNASGTPKPGGGTYGTTGSATVTLSAADFTARNLTFANTFDRASHPEITDTQAVAVKTQADRMVFDRVRFLGHQDTLYVNSPSTATVSRHYFHDCYLAGDVDFIFGRGTAVFADSVIDSLDRGTPPNNGYVTAASTDIHNPYGFLFVHDRFVSEAAAGTVHLGRPWHPGGDPNAVAQVVIRDSWLGPQFPATGAWADFPPFAAKDARYAEYRTAGPGAIASPDRPRLTAAQAAGYQPADYLAGADGWHPEGR